ncbi:MAG: regulatory protein RecX [bacterium]
MSPKKSGPISEGEIRTVKSPPVDGNQVREWALRILAYRALTAQELKERLVRKGASLSMADKVIKDLRVQRLIDEEAIVEDTVRLSREDRGESRFGVITRLRNRGVPTSTIEKILNCQYPEEEEFSVALRWAIKRWKHLSHNKDLNNREEKLKLLRKLAGSLERRGFPYEVVGKVLREVDYHTFTED